MAGSERKRQEKLARNAAKRKQRQKEIRRAQAESRPGMSTMDQVALVSHRAELDEFLQAMERLEGPAAELPAEAPVHASLVPAELFETGIGNVVISRKLPDGKIAVACFLLDVWCLGVKNAFLKVASADSYPTILRQISGRQHLNPMDPACFRKLVEDAEAYAADLGFGPHPDYQLARRIFGNIDKNACRTQFRFGKDGKPFYMSGPNEDEAKSKRIVDTLLRRCGPDNFHYIVALDAPPEGLEFGDEDVIEGQWVEGQPSMEEGQPQGLLSRFIRRPRTPD